MNLFDILNDAQILTAERSKTDVMVLVICNDFPTNQKIKVCYNVAEITMPSYLMPYLTRYRKHSFSLLLINETFLITPKKLFLEDEEEI